MAGKAYSMKEMKMIVNYLTEHRAYGETKARKMWVDFANSKITDRTWQSLKETFLKRILPDIHNPYYRLTTEQIASFRQGHDIAQENMNKLEIHTIESDDSSSTESKKKQPSISKNEEEVSGENTSLKIISRNRSSADTVIIEKCNDNAMENKDCEVIQIDNEGEDASNPKSPTRSLRDLITYSDPLTPLLQEVLHDFASESEGSDREPAMQIVEDVDISDKNHVDKLQNKSPAKGSESEKTIEEQIEKLHEDIQNDEAQQKEKDLNLSKDVNKINVDNSFSLEKSNKAPAIQLSNSIHNCADIVTCSNSTSDTTLPNNQEGLYKNLKDISECDSENKILQNKLSLKVKTVNNISSAQENSSDIASTKKTEDNTQNNGFKNDQKDSHSDDIAKPSTSNDKTVNENKSNIGSNTETNKNCSKSNPCLNSVSLYAEELNASKNFDSDSAEDFAAVKDKEDKKQQQRNKIVETVVVDDIDEIAILNSHSAAENDESIKQKTKDQQVIIQSQKNRDLAKAFGFSRGSVARNTARSSYRNRRNPSCHNRKSLSSKSSGSSDWKSDSENEYVSPPRGRRNKSSYMYLKPKSARLIALEEEGGLCLIQGKRVIPFTKDRKSIKSYLTYLADSDSEEDENYWKLKYVKEKKKSDELKMMLESEVNGARHNSKSPILGATSKSKTVAFVGNRETSSSNQNRNGDVVIVPETVEEKRDGNIKQENKTVKIKLIKNNEEVQVEGHWSQIHPVLDHVVQMFHKDSPTEKKSTLLDVPEQTKTSSGQSTPVSVPIIDPVVHEKVTEIEKEIFKEIEERAKNEEVDSKTSLNQTNVTLRNRGRLRPLSSSPVSPPITPKKQRLSKTEKQRNSGKKQTDKQAKGAEKQEINTKNQVESAEKKRIQPERVHNNDVVKDATKLHTVEAETDTNKSIERKPQKSPKKTETSHPETVRPKRNRLSKTIETVANDVEDESDVRYMIPTTRKIHSRKSGTGIKEGKRGKRSKVIVIPTKTMTSPDMSLNSIESSQGYQDSDMSPMKSCLKKKRKLSLTITQRRVRKHRYPLRNYPEFAQDISDSSNSSIGTKLQKRTQNYSLNSEMYKSESYQLLLPQAKPRLNQLEIIDETSPAPKKVDPSATSNYKSLSPISLTNEDSVDKDCNKSNVSIYINVEMGSSSNVSLPLSPELSVVENLSITKDTLNNIEVHSNFDESNSIEGADERKQKVSNKYLMSDVDVSMPLMAQECGIEQTYAKTPTQPCIPLVSDTLVNKINNVNIKETTLSDSLDRKLRDLLLESAKKIANYAQCSNHKENAMEVDNTDIDKKITKSRKRCSTPRKKKNDQISMKPPVVTVVEEHTESLSRNTRKSCPSKIEEFPVESGIAESGTNAVQKGNVTVKKSRETGKKKDIIKVRILRPLNLKKIKKTSVKRSTKASNISVYTDSGINNTESGIFLQEMNDSVNLIHNHSETCVHGNECIDESVEVLEKSKSIISLNSSKTTEGTSMDDKLKDIEKDLPEVLCCDAQDVPCFNEALENKEAELFRSPVDTVYHSPVMEAPAADILNSSLLTEDLSDESPIPTFRPSKWYLLSEDETNTNMIQNQQVDSVVNSFNFGSNLKQLFPITCAVPDLSTITENDECSRKPTLDEDGTTRNSPGLSLDSRTFDCIL